jgi:hypothetical protein
MSIAGWILIVIGIIAFVSGLVMALKEQFKKVEVVPPPVNRVIELKDVADLLKQLAAVFKAFKDLNAGIQWAILGVACIGVGGYFLQIAAG